MLVLKRVLLFGTLLVQTESRIGQGIGIGIGKWLLKESDGGTSRACNDIVNQLRLKIIELEDSLNQCNPTDM